MNNTTNSEKIHAIGCRIDNVKIQKRLKQITSIKSLALPVVCLPDLHLKKHLEAPSSFAAATENTMIPSLSSASMNCGMGVIATNLTKEDLVPENIEAFYKNMQEHLGEWYGFWKRIALRLGFIKRQTNKYDLTEKELENVIRHGAGAVINKYNLGTETLSHIEYSGSLFSKERAAKLNLKGLIPKVTYYNSRHDLGYGFSGNHFLEIQYVEDIFDEETARAWALTKDQVVIMYHGGGGALSYNMGRYFANRKKDGALQKLILFLQKLFFHFGSPEGIKNFAKRWRYYFFPKPFQEIPLSTKEGLRLFASFKIGLNYGYAFRMAMLARIRDALKKALSDKNPEIKLIYDASHNSITKERIKGKDVIVHRHNAIRVFPENPVILAGFNTTNSYLALGLAGAEDKLFAADHGAGESIKQFEKRGDLQNHPDGFKTTIYKTTPPYQKIVTHTTNAGLDYVMDHLEREGIARRVVSFRPIAVFKG